MMVLSSLGDFLILGFILPAVLSERLNNRPFLVHSCNPSRLPRSILGFNAGSTGVFAKRRSSRDKYHHKLSPLHAASENWQRAAFSRTSSDNISTHNTWIRSIDISRMPRYLPELSSSRYSSTFSSTRLSLISDSEMLTLSNQMTSSPSWPLSTSLSLSFLPWWPSAEYMFDFVALSLGAAAAVLTASIVISHKDDSIDAVKNKTHNEMEVKRMKSIESDPIQLTSEICSPDSIYSDVASFTSELDGDEQFIDNHDISPQGEDNALLTPQTYATSRSAKRQVEDTILRTASSAFSSTDFSHEPHLSQELKDAETVYEVALLANAAHAMADAAEQENRQSLAAMLERGREIEWIEQRGMWVSSRNNREAQIGDKSIVSFEDAIAFSKDTPANANRTSSAVERVSSLKSLNVSTEEAVLQAEKEYMAAVELEVKEKLTLETERQRNDSQTEWMESEARAASMGGQEHLPFNVACAAASFAATNAWAATELEAHDRSAMDDKMKPTQVNISMRDQKLEKNNDVGFAAMGSVPMKKNQYPNTSDDHGENVSPSPIQGDVNLARSTASILAETAERMILADDIAYFEQTAPLSEPPPVSSFHDNEGVGCLTTIPDNQQPGLQADKEPAQEQHLSEVDQWRKDYIQEIRSYVQQKGVEETRYKMSRNNGHLKESQNEKTGGRYDNLVNVHNENNILSKTSEVDDAGIEAGPSKETLAKITSEKVNFIKKASENGLTKHFRRRRRLILAAVFVVLSRRLVLAWFGNALRLV